MAKLLTAALSKYGRRSLLVTLQALLHARQDHSAEALAAVDEVLASRPTDAHLLSTLTAVYKQLDMTPSICLLYSNAIAALEPALPAEELLVALYFAHTAVRAYDRAQAVAIKLYNLYKQPHYLFYSAATRCCASSSSSSPSSAPLLRVSERLIRRGYSLTAMTVDDVEPDLPAAVSARRPPRGTAVDTGQGRRDVQSAVGRGTRSHDRSLLRRARPPPQFARLVGADVQAPRG